MPDYNLSPTQAKMLEHIALNGGHASYQEVKSWRTGTWRMTVGVLRREGMVVNRSRKPTEPSWHHDEILPIQLTLAGVRELPEAARRAMLIRAWDEAQAAGDSPSHDPMGAVAVTGAYHNGHYETVRPSYAEMTDLQRERAWDSLTEVYGLNLAQRRAVQASDVHEDIVYAAYRLDFDATDRLMEGLGLYRPPVPPEPLAVLMEQYVTARLAGLTRDTPPPQSMRDVDAAKAALLKRWEHIAEVFVAANRREQLDRMTRWDLL